jgi:hypothetical protein
MPRTVALLTALVFTAAAVACTDEERPQSSATATSTTTTAPTSQTDAGVPLKAERKVCTDVPDPAPRDGTKAVKVFLLCDDSLYGHYLVGVTRLIPAEEGPLRGAIRELLQGPTPAEREAGLYANFTAEHTGGALREVRIEDGRAVVNLDSRIRSTPAMNNVTTSAGGYGFFWPLYATVFQFPEVKEILPQWDGDADAWGAWDQAGEGPFPREDYPTAPVPIDEDRPIAASIYVAQVMQRFARAPWFKTIQFVQPEGDSLGVTVDDVGATWWAREIARAVGRILADSRRFCAVREVEVRDGPDDRSNLAWARKAQGSNRLPVPCWHDGYDVSL